MSASPKSSKRVAEAEAEKVEVKGEADKNAEKEKLYEESEVLNEKRRRFKIDLAALESEITHNYRARHQRDWEEIKTNYPTRDLAGRLQALCTLLHMWLAWNRDTKFHKHGTGVIVEVPRADFFAERFLRVTEDGDVFAAHSVAPVLNLLTMPLAQWPAAPKEGEQ